MAILESLLKTHLNEQASNDMSRLPADVLKSIKTNIRNGAEDLNQNWANALELVHKAYEIEGAQRPSPDMESAWKQYEENLQYAVEQLAKNRGMDSDWRMSASIFHEALQNKEKFEVMIGDDAFITECESVLDLINRLSESINNENLEVQVTKSNNEYNLSFNRFGIKKNAKVTIRKL